MVRIDSDVDSEAFDCVSSDCALVVQSLLFFEADLVRGSDLVLGRWT